MLNDKIHPWMMDTKCNIPEEEKGERRKDKHILHAEQVIQQMFSKSRQSGAKCVFLCVRC